MQEHQQHKEEIKSDKITQIPTVHQQSEHGEEQSADHERRGSDTVVSQDERMRYDDKRD